MIDINLMKKTAIILLAAGKSSRFSNNSSILKQFYKLEGKPLYRYSLDFFNSYKYFNIFLVVPKDFENLIKEETKYFSNLSILKGGDSRTESVYNSLQFIKNQYPFIEYCIVHDVARPLLNEKIIKSFFENVSRFQSMTAAIKATDTIAMGDNLIESYIDRNLVYFIQTPQFFTFELLYKCYQEYFSDKDRKNFTDDTSLVYRYAKINAKIIEGDKRLFKITTEEDLSYIRFLINGE